MKNPKYFRRLEQIPQLRKKEVKELQPVVDKFDFRTNEYYQSLIDWKDPDDPIRRIVIPDINELNEWGELDASDEQIYTVLPGLEHKYEFTVVLLVSYVCGAYCRFCFRKRLFTDDNDDVLQDMSEGIKYIQEHKEITNVLLTGGDPLILSTRKLESIIRDLFEIDHVKMIRIGTKIPAFNPIRILNDPALLSMIENYSTSKRKIYIMTHFNHPRELTDYAVESIHLLQKAGGITVNQTPLIRGVNDTPEILSELFRKLSFIGVPPYYVFQCRPTLGNYTYTVPLEKAYEIFEQARMRCSGLGKRARFVMSHSTGKIEVVGKTEKQIFMRYHRAANLEEKAKFMVFDCNPAAYWFDDYEEYIEEYTPKKPSLIQLNW